MLRIATASGMTAGWTAAQMGLRVFVPASGTQPSIIMRNAANAAGARPMRPSHNAYPPDEWKGSNWGWHQTRWDQGKHVPIPFTRGIPFCGDVFSGDRYMMANRQLG